MTVLFTDIEGSAPSTPELAATRTGKTAMTSREAVRLLGAAAT